jgi:hypothetical protein
VLLNESEGEAILSAIQEKLERVVGWKDPDTRALVQAWDKLDRARRMSEGDFTRIRVEAPTAKRILEEEIGEGK